VLQWNLEIVKILDMAIVLSDNIQVNAPKPVDSRYLNILVPYSSVGAANTAIVSGVRYTGLTVNINSSEYWYKNGILDTDLIIKLGGGSAITGATNGLSVFNNNVILGGTLNGNTTISGTTYNLNLNVANFNITGIVKLLSTPTGGTTTDAILVWNSVDKKIKLVSANIINVCNISGVYSATTNNSFIAANAGSTIYLPNNPNCGQKISIADCSGNALANNICVCSTTHCILNCNMAIINTDYGSMSFVYNNVFWSAVAFTN
jgi:hypothetical protein